MKTRGLIAILIVGLLAPVPVALAFKTCAVTSFSAGPVVLPGESSDPAAAGSSIYAAYSDPTGLVVQVSSDNGLSWTPALLDVQGSFPRIAAIGSQAYVAWFTGSRNSWSVGFARSSNAGSTFTISNLGSTYMLPGSIPNEDGEIQIAAEGARVSLIYPSADGAAMTVASSADYGNTFTFARIPSVNLPTEGDIQMTGRKIAVTWNDWGTDGLVKVFTSRSLDGGQTFSNALNLTPDGVETREPIMALAGKSGPLYLVWRASKTDQGLTVGYITRSDDFGLTWSEPKLIDEVTKRGRQFSVLAVDQTVYVSYMRHRAPDYWWSQLRISRDGGATFEAPVSLGNTGISGQLDDEDHAPRMWASGDLLRIVFGIDGSVYVRSSTDRGAHLAGKTLLGTGDSALPGKNSVIWEGADGSAQFATCK